MAEGAPAEAAPIFARLSDQAQRHHMPVRAANLALQASRAHLAADMVDSAVAQARRGLHLLAQTGKDGRLALLLPRITTTLRDKGYGDQAEELDEDVRESLQDAGRSLDEVKRRVARPPEDRGDLPAACQGCGAPLTPDDVAWHDARTAECLYCGAVLKAT
jgi:hypothetical protein